jgi:hypothetical protein
MSSNPSPNYDTTKIAPVAPPAPATVAVQAIDPEVAAAQELARRYRMEFVDLVEAELDYDLINEISVDLLTRYKFIPLRREGERLVVAMVDPVNLDALDELAAQLKVRLKPVVGARAAIESPCVAAMRRNAYCKTQLRRFTSGW